MRVSAVGAVLSGVLCIFAGNALAELPVKSEGRVHVRHSTTDLNSIEDPAQVQVTWPHGAESTYVVDLGVSVDVLKNEYRNRWMVGPTAEYHKNTTIDKEQDVLQFGGLVLWSGGDVSRDPFVPNLQGSVKYKNDRIAEAESAQAIGEFLPVARDLWMGYLEGPSWLQLLWQPTVGLEYENILDTPAGGTTGYVFWAVGTIEVGFHPAADLLKHRLVVTVSATEWKGLSSTSGLDAERETESEQLFEASLVWYFDSVQHFGVGLDYVNGANPRESLPDQEYTQASLKIKY